MKKTVIFLLFNVGSLLQLLCIFQVFLCHLHIFYSLTKQAKALLLQCRTQGGEMPTSPGPEAESENQRPSYFFILNFTRWTVLTLAPINSLTPHYPIKNDLMKFLFDSLRMLYDSQKQIIPFFFL